MAAASSLPGGGFMVHESWSNSGTLWTTMGRESMAAWLLVDGSSTPDCQLLEHRTAGMLQKEKEKWGKKNHEQRVMRE